MLTAELINNNIPRLQLQDSVGKAIRLINDYRVTHLPVVNEEIYLGMISEDDLLDAYDEKSGIEILQEHFVHDSVKDDVHFLNAVNYTSLHETSIVPVISKTNALTGVITAPDLLKAMAAFSGSSEFGGIIVLEMERQQFSVSQISRIVESNDAVILNLNTTRHADSGMLTVTLHLNKQEVSAIVTAFERYEYSVLYSFGDEKFEDNIDTNYRHLMNYLDI
ncbi:CBS domain-containing protein [Ferruginibacter paludis]|uniref:CBS domain-containing protein n=1 Tax=Ferruginibacter paludis TaxID=1310417 RepID=UPI0025B3B295|nr:CBS domain-containing protein [Ferruginibacter paludis]MDN3658413.1 CBS domain-containing protein [Ferruginibacter paludis]